MALIQYLDVGTVLCGVVAFLVARAILRQRNTSLKMPPGPFRLPVIGTLYAHGLDPRKLAKLREKHGDICSVYIGPRHVVLIQGFDKIQQASKMTELSDRAFSEGFVSNLTNPNSKGVLAAPYKNAKHTRTTSLAIFRELGVGRSIMEEKVLNVVEQLKTSFAQTNQHSFDPAFPLEYAVTKVILFTALNKIPDENDPKFRSFVTAVRDVMTSFLGVVIVTEIPPLRFIPPFKAKFQQFVNGTLKIIKQISIWVDEHIQNHASETNEDFINRYLSKDSVMTNDSSTFDREQLIYIVRDLLVAGSDTSTTSLLWTLLCLANRPKLQQKLREEVNNVEGSVVHLKDKVNLPYMEAFISEVQRYYTLAPLGVAHEACEDVEFCGFDIPKSTMILFNIYAIHHDERLWADPHCFKPERFLDGDGKYKILPHYIPFSSGKRSCLGEVLARQELFLFVANLIRNFEILPPKGVDEISEDGEWKFIYRPKPFQVRMLHLQDKF